MNKPLSLWLGFFTLVLVLIILDLGLFNKKDKQMSFKRSLWLSIGYFTISLLFGSYIYCGINGDDGEDFFTGYFIEKSLSLDNVFVMAMIFAHFSIPEHYQHRVLFWGVLGAIILRGILIMLGVEIVQSFHPILYLFGAFLVFTGMKMFLAKEEDKENIADNKILHFIQKFIPVTEKLHGNRFIIRHKTGETARFMATPLLLVLVFIELIDVVFALDSVPAILSITTDSFVVYTSNIFAILGLRALYFVLADSLHRFHYLKYSLALVLISIGGKIFLSDILPIPSEISLGFTLLLLIGGIAVSLYKTAGKK